MEDIESSTEITIYNHNPNSELRTRKPLGSPSVVRLEEKRVFNDDEKFEFNTYSPHQRQKDDVQMAREDINKYMDAFYDHLMNYKVFEYFFKDTNNPNWNPQTRKKAQKICYSIAALVFSGIILFMIIYGIKITPKIHISTITHRFESRMLGPFQDVETFNKGIKTCRNANPTELITGNFILQQNETHRLYLNLNHTRDILIKAITDNHTDLMCASMLDPEYNMPCACSMSYENEKGGYIFFINPHIMRVDEKSAEIKEIFPMIIKKDERPRIIPIGMEIEYFDMETGRDGKIYFEKLYVNLFIHILDFIGSYFKPHDTPTEIK